ncbi:MAG: hypothetical protein ACJ788_23745 [Ktedonobacteraceae bacterium]
MQTYLLDLVTLLQILARQKQSGVLQARDVRLPDGRRTAQARLVLVQGKIQSCTLFLQPGTNIIAGGDIALQMLYELGTLEWQWTAGLPQMKPPEEQYSVPSVDGRPPLQENWPLPRRSVPQRTAQADMADLYSLSRNHRRVLALIDGQRSVDKIAAMLALTDQQELFKILNELHAWGLIV